MIKLHQLRYPKKKAFWRTIFISSSSCPFGTIGTTGYCFVNLEIDCRRDVVGDIRHTAFILYYA
jgi:hypothetical protein